MRAHLLSGLTAWATALVAIAACSSRSDTGAPDASASSDASVDASPPGSDAPFGVYDGADTASPPPRDAHVDAVSDCTGGGPCDDTSVCCPGMSQTLTCRGTHTCLLGACATLGASCPIGKKAECCVGNGCDATHHCVVCVDPGGTASSAEECCGASATDAGAGLVTCK